MPIALLAVEAVRENVVRLTFDARVYLSGLQDEPDASVVAPDAGTVRYIVSVVNDGAVGLDGRLARPVAPLYAELAKDVEPEGFDIDVVLDRPMSPYPCRYSIAVARVWDESLTAPNGPAIFDFDGLFKEVTPALFDPIAKNRDIANPQTKRALSRTVSADDPLGLATTTYDDSGDVAFDEGLLGYQKLILRCLFTRKGGFLHLPNFGVGVPQLGKKLSTPSTRAQTIAEAESQIAKLPPTAAVNVSFTQPNPREPGLWRMNIRARTKTGLVADFGVPVRT